MSLTTPLHKLFVHLERLFRPAPPPAVRIREALARFRDPTAETLPLLHDLVACLRPGRREEPGAVGERYALLLDCLEREPDLLAAFRQHLIPFLASRRLVNFFTDSGILPGTGFFSEWWRIIWHRLLPDAPDERYLKDCVNVIYDRPRDWQWMNAVPPELSQRFWGLVAPSDELSSAAWRGMLEQLLEAALLLAQRVAGLGVESELMRATPDFEGYAPRFIALSTEAHHYAESLRGHFADPVQPADDGSQLLVIADQCADALERIRKRSLTVGTSLHLTFVLTRSRQSLERLRELLAMLGASIQEEARHAAVDAWAAFAREALLAENRRNSFRHYWNQVSRLLAVRVTENAARSGEHYICETRSDYRAMWFSAMGGGILIGSMALLKIFAGGLHAPPLVEAFLYSCIYGLGFVVIYLLGFTVATKQPAMTAQTLAGYLSGLSSRKTEEIERIADLVTAVSRSQIAAILGNIAIAFPTALALASLLLMANGAPAIAVEKSSRLLADLDPLAWALPHAAVAGFYLFLSGLITGYVDNQAAYGNIGARVARLRWLRGLLGARRAAAVGSYVESRAGGITGNFLFGCMLGSTGTLGLLLGLPLDIRHIAFASANLGYAISGFGYVVPWQSVAWAALGVALIGFTNLAVSFALALRTALRARRADNPPWGTLLRAIGRRLRTQPRDFLLPPRPEPALPAGGS